MNVSYFATAVSAYEEPPLQHRDAYAVVVANTVADLEQVGELLHSNLPVLLVRDLDQARRLVDGEPAAAGGARHVPALQAGQLEIRPDEQRAWWRGAALELTGQEIALLACLARQSGGVVSFRELVRDVWGASCGVDTTVIHSAVRRLRRKLERAGVEVRIASVRGYGLRLAGEDVIRQ
ncbi:winged helix-turn-helix domain-containing protein [Streptomyces lydicus]|uniref:winged helix-turn-helix domain-containing protein n=1 Tax=Streptomyces lydicus TaxID=47763 RepID=UPI00068AD5AC|nr:winged helix-turn-helix domain-containing protein [Streptomyces lydicus]MDC7338846.1 winged helix-turn-helix domain-containing protein [Streptomyces lydicus]UEG91672.1 winged helix-turn-helix domain-containing protein [Streptomyces lydicus]